MLCFIELCHNSTRPYIAGLVQDCSNSIANALELLQSCTKPAIYALLLHLFIAAISSFMFTWMWHWVIYLLWNELIYSLAPGISECESENVNFNLVLLIDFFRFSHDNAPRWMPQDLTDAKSALVQVIAWCRQATSHYLSQWCLSSLSPYGVASPQWVNILIALWSLETLNNLQNTIKNKIILHWFFGDSWY